MNDHTAQTTEQPEELPVSDGTSPPEDQVQGMATPEDLADAEQEKGNV